MFNSFNNGYYGLDLLNDCHRKSCILYFILIKEDVIEDYIDLKVCDKLFYIGSMYVFWNKNEFILFL